MTNSRQNLFEYIDPSSKPLISESFEDGKDRVLKLKGLFIQGEVQNHNGRIYPRVEIEKAVQSINSKINSVGPVIGELDHPDGLNINLDRASHVIKKMWMEGANGFGEMEVIDEGMGKIVYGLVKRGAQLGVSSRGSGAVGGDGRVNDFDIVTIDIVANPSAPDALPRALRESLEKHYSGRNAASLTEALKYDPKAQRHFQKAFDQFLTDIRDELVWRKS